MLINNLVNKSQAVFDAEFCLFGKIDEANDIITTENASKFINDTFKKSYVYYALSKIHNDLFNATDTNNENADNDLLNALKELKAINPEAFDDAIRAIAAIIETVIYNESVKYTNYATSIIDEAATLAVEAVSDINNDADDSGDNTDEVVEP